MEIVSVVVIVVLVLVGVVVIIIIMMMMVTGMNVVSIRRWMPIAVLITSMGNSFSMLNSSFDLSTSYMSVFDLFLVYFILNLIDRALL